MTYDVILESVSPEFHGPVVAALLTVRIPSRTIWKEVAGLRSGTTVGLGLGLEQAARTASSAPCTLVKGLTADDGQFLKTYLEAGHYPENKDWPRPEPGQTCCVVVVRESGHD